MGLVLTIELLTGSYDAAQADDRTRAEWPPHPARLFCALVAAARSEADREALRWLETQPAPVIVAADQPREAMRTGYVVTNRRVDKGGSQAHPGRTNGLRSRTRALPAHPSVAIAWPGVVAPEVVRALDDMARRIPYLGRSTGIALVAAAATTEDPGAGGDHGARQVYEPCGVLDGDVSLRVAYPGYLAELDAQFAAGRPAWEVGRYCGYRRRAAPRQADALTTTTAALVPSVYTDVLVFQFAGLKPQAQLAVRLTEALRSAVLRSAGHGAPPALHGHDADGRPHVAFLALPDVGHEHADGHLLGVAVAVPDLPDQQRSTVLRAVLGLRRTDANGVVEMSVPQLGVVELIYQPGLVRPWGASPQRWRRGSRRWVSATPVVLDRYPKKPGQEASEVRRCLRTVGLPEPVDVQVSREPLMLGAARLRPSDLPASTKGRLFRHVAVTFDRPVSGPVLVGAGRYLGIGLLAPVSAGGADA